MTDIAQPDAPTPRAADRRDVAPLAALWWDGWQDAHRAILPPEVAADRTLASFHDRLMRNIASVRTIGDVGTPLGFSLVAGCELNQFYVGRAARGGGVAGALIGDAEARLRAAGARRAWLACAIGNDRAARFYERHAWRRAGVETITLPLGSGAFDLAVWRYEKELAAAAP
jgi:GNAT superfamily N-acetyltransferase